ncbi:MAG: sigma-70 family RNA polymerase sigma factor [Marmoricola sp.]
MSVRLSVRDLRRKAVRGSPPPPAVIDDAEDTTADEQLLAELYRRHARVLFAFVLRLVDDRAKAEDVVQETMLRAWRNLDAIDPRRGDPGSYLFTVAKNVVIDTWRAEQRRPRLVTDEETLAAQPVEDRLDARVDAWMVHLALERLSVEHRAVVDHLYYAGSTVTETAQSLGIPPGTVKSRAYYAVRVLRTAFEEMGMTR